MERLLKTFGIIILVMALFAGAFVVYSHNAQNADPSFAESNLPKVSEILPTPTPVVRNNAITQTIVSPDGKKTLTFVQKESQSENTWTINIDEEQIYTANLPKNVTLSVPFNTFSPDNKYIFLKQDEGTNAGYIVLATSGKPVFATDQAVEITGPFYDKYQNYKITDVTGWGGTNLLVVNTDKLDASIGPSFWFSVPTKSFIQLSTRFN